MDDAHELAIRRQIAQAQSDGDQSSELAARRQLAGTPERSLSADIVEPRNDYAISEMSGPQRFAAGAGRAVVNAGRGIKQLGAMAMDAIDPQDQSLSDLIVGKPQSRSDRVRAEIDEAARLDAPLLDTTGGSLGNIAGTAATYLGPSVALRGAGALATGAGALRGAPAVVNAGEALSGLGRAAAGVSGYRNAATVGAGIGTAQPVGTGESRTANTFIAGAGGLAGQGIANTLVRIARPVVNRLSPQQRQAADLLRANDVTLTPGQATQSRVLQNTEAALSNIPSTANAAQRAGEAQQGQFNRAALDVIGENADAATPEVMGAARARLGGEFDRLTQNATLNFDTPLLADLAQIETGYMQQLPTNQRPIVESYLNDLLNAGQQGTIPGVVYQRTRSMLDKQIKAARNNDPTLAGALRGIREALDGSAERSLPQADLVDWRLARSQYRNMRNLEGAVNADGLGNISPSLLANRLKTVDRNATTYGVGDTRLPELASAGKAILPEKVGNPGTAQRALYQNLLTGSAGGATGGLVGYAAGGDIGSAGKAALTGATLFVGLPRATQAALNNPAVREYLINGSPALQRAFGITPEILTQLARRPLGLTISPNRTQLGETPQQ